MKKHISITIESDVIKSVEKLAIGCHRSISQVLELAAVEYLKSRVKEADHIPSTKTFFRGTFSRVETYGDR